MYDYYNKPKLKIDLTEAIEETEKILKKELETSAQYEDLNRLIFLLEKQLKNNSFLPYENADVVRAEILKRIKSFSDQREVCTHLYIIYTRLLNLRYTVALRTTVLQQQEITLLQRNLIHYLPAKLNHTISLIYYYQASLLAEFMMGTTDSTIKLNLQLLNCWIQKPHQINAYPELFIRSVSVQAYTNFLLKEISVAKSYADSYRQLAEKHLNIPFYKQWFLIVEFHTLTKILHKTFRYDELTIYFAKNWDGIYHSIRVLRAAEKLDLLVTASITFFVLGDLQHAENYIQESKEINLKVNRVDTLYFTFIFHCLILFEKKEWNRLNSLINSEYHFLYSHKSLMPFEKDMLLFIKKMPFIIIKDNGIQKMELFLQKLDSYKDDKSKKLHFAYFDFYAWIQSKIEGIGYRQYRVSNADHLS